MVVGCLILYHVFIRKQGNRPGRSRQGGNKNRGYLKQYEKLEQWKDWDEWIEDDY